MGGPKPLGPRRPDPPYRPELGKIEHGSSQDPDELEDAIRDALETAAT